MARSGKRSASFSEIHPVIAAANSAGFLSRRTISDAAVMISGHYYSTFVGKNVAARHAFDPRTAYKALGMTKRPTTWAEICQHYGATCLEMFATKRHVLRGLTR